MREMGIRGFHESKNHLRDLGTLVAPGSMPARETQMVQRNVPSPRLPINPDAIVLLRNCNMIASSTTV
jgi:hypothetical protein